MLLKVYKIVVKVWKGVLLDTSNYIGVYLFYIWSQKINSSK